MNRKIKRLRKKSNRRAYRSLRKCASDNDLLEVFHDVQEMFQDGDERVFSNYDNGAMDEYYVQIEGDKNKVYIIAFKNIIDEDTGDVYMVSNYTTTTSAQLLKMSDSEFLQIYNRIATYMY